ncbi:hypothetical protein [Adhaeribacter pallidiroseus]|uniref:Uncharacterized protein n=1 Tax=Adhaeribacter pallidiroseus TaxID=2072847 RepID=A0A369Q9Z6_9BACT|nr:hypothetical protein [Adhaeribacter pallidiroseus]RDC61721.1 hypothetical protein AHMF7616_00303 [Adhaeribacter pallidiroseus]
MVPDSLEVNISNNPQLLVTRVNFIILPFYYMLLYQLLLAN